MQANFVFFYNWKKNAKKEPSERAKYKNKQQQPSNEMKKKKQQKTRKIYTLESFVLSTVTPVLWVCAFGDTIHCNLFRCYIFQNHKKIVFDEARMNTKNVQKKWKESNGRWRFFLFLLLTPNSFFRFDFIFWGRKQNEIWWCTRCSAELRKEC